MIRLSGIAALALGGAFALQTSALAGEGCTSSRAMKTVYASQAGTCSGAMPETVALGAMGTKDIVDTAVSAGSFNTLVAAVKAANLVEALKAEGPYTVFAPTDEAFARIPKANLEALLLPENRETLTAILTFHVVPGRVMAADVLKLSAAETLNGQRVRISATGGKVKIDDATVIKADIACSNGVIHVIDRVLMPSTKNIVETAVDAGTFKTLAAALTAADLAATLGGSGPYTVFAPTDEAFAKLPPGTVEMLLLPENRDKLIAILTYHVVPGRVYADQVVKIKTAKTVQGEEIRIQVTGGRVKIDNATVAATDIQASNGVIHVIDEVILPAG